MRPAAERLGATQFEVITAAALAEFADAGVDVAVVEAGLGGRHDATNVLALARRPADERGLDHTEVLGETVEEIAAEKLAVAHTGHDSRPAGRRAARALVPARRGRASAAPGEAAEAFLGRPIEPRRRAMSSCPGRLERAAPARSGTARTTRPASAGCARACPAADYTLCASILADKDADAMLAGSRRVGRPLRRDRVVERRARSRRRARRAGPAVTSPPSRPCADPARRWRARTRSASRSS